jgi:hypothetical protein
MTLDFTPAAVSDLRSIRAYTLATWGPRQEQIYLEKGYVDPCCCGEKKTRQE